MLQLNKVRDLCFDNKDSGKPHYIGAASGLVQTRYALYVVADDELYLGVFPLASNSSSYPAQWLTGELSSDLARRKAHKPDLETLTLFPLLAQMPYGALFAMGSGSRPNRQTGVLWALDHVGRLNGHPYTVDLSNMFSLLQNHLSEVNVEGAIVTAENIKLLQRGNQGQGKNAIAELMFSFTELNSRQLRIDANLIDITEYDLGEIGGVKLAFTDAAPLTDGRTVFTATAEHTIDSYQDGPCLGSAVGVINRAGMVESVEVLDQRLKIEGIEARLTNQSIDLLLVNDPDDRALPATLFSVTYPLHGSR